MKRAAIFLLLLLCPLVQADTVSDAYKDGANTGKSSSGQGTAALSGGDPGSFIPGYTANPPQADYYGGVQGGDGGISDKGLAAFTNSDAGQAVTDSATKNPPVTIDPNADYIQVGKNAEANAGTMVDGTSAQCTEKVVSKTTFQNYSCDRDVAVIQTCGRTGTVTGHYEDTTKISTIRIHSSSLHFGFNGVPGDTPGVATYTMPAATVTSATFTYIFNMAGHDDILFNVSTLGRLFTMYERSGSYNIPLSRKFSAGEQLVFTLGNPGNSNRIGNIWFSANLYSTYVEFTLTLTTETKTRVYVPETKWTESCGFDKSTATANIGSVCTEPGSTKTVVVDGQTYSQTSDCWAYSDSYVTATDSTGTCGSLMSDKNCTRSTTSCTETENGACTHQSEVWECQKTYTSGGLLCGDDYFCKTGDCGETGTAGDSGFDLAVAKLAGLASAGDDVKNGDQIDIKAFTGQSMACRKAMAGFSNCCVDSGWGNSTGLANCSSEEMAIGKAKEKKVTVLVGEACNHKVLGVCIQKKQVYCVFGGKLARIIQEQGRRDQLHISFGEGDDPNCRGITVPELKAINFDKINFSDFYSDLMDNQKIPDTEAMTKIARERIAAQVNQQTTGSSK